MRSKSKWRKLRSRDGFVRQASRLGVRSRSYFKLKEIDKEFKLIKSDMVVLDLGAAPGGWSEYCISKIQSPGKVVAIDVLEMKPLPGVEVVHCDLTQQDCVSRINSILQQNKADLILSDMAPNITGNVSIDAHNYQDVYQAIFSICGALLTQSGSLVFKFFQTHQSVKLKQHCQSMFRKVTTFKPQSSRANSQEMYLVATGFDIASYDSSLLDL